MIKNDGLTVCVINDSRMLYEYFFLVILIYFKVVLFQKQSTGLQTTYLSKVFVQAPRQQSLSQAQSK
jgi:hypothetical protein